MRKSIIFALALLFCLFFAQNASALYVEGVEPRVSGNYVYLSSDSGVLTVGTTYHYMLDITVDSDYMAEFDVSDVHPRLMNYGNTIPNTYHVIIDGNHFLLDYNFISTSSLTSVGNIMGFIFPVNMVGHVTINRWILESIKPRTNLMPIFNPKIYEKRVGETANTVNLDTLTINPLYGAMPQNIVTSVDLSKTYEYIREQGSYIDTRVLGDASLSSSTAFMPFRQYVGDIDFNVDPIQIGNWWGEAETEVSYIPYLTSNSFGSVPYYPSFDNLIVGGYNPVTFTPAGGVVRGYPPSTPDAEPSGFDFTVTIGFLCGSFTSCTVSGIDADTVYSGNKLILYCHSEEEEFDLSDMTISISMNNSRSVCIYSFIVAATESDSVILSALNDLRIDIQSGFSSVYWATVGIAQSLVNNIQNWNVDEEGSEASAGYDSAVEAQDAAETVLTSATSSYIDDFNPDPSGLSDIVPAFGLVSTMMTAIYNRLGDYQALCTFFLIFSVILFALQMRK